MNRREAMKVAKECHPDSKPGVYTGVMVWQGVVMITGLNGEVVVVYGPDIDKLRVALEVAKTGLDPPALQTPREARKHSSGPSSFLAGV